MNLLPATPLALLGCLGFMSHGTADEISSGKNRFRLSGLMLFNVEASFSDAGGLLANSPGIAAAAGDHFYDDGFVRVDNSDNAGGLTWFWGYNNSSQLGADSITFSSSATDAYRSKGIHDDPHPGVELSYSRELCQCLGIKWGIEAAGGYANIDIKDSRPLSAPVRSVTDTYPLGGVLAPVAPYAGSFNGPGPLIGDTPTRSITTTSTGATATGFRKISADAFLFRLGPYLEIPAFSHLSFNLHSGLAAGVIHSEFSFAERVSLPGGGAFRQTGRSDSTTTLLGIYVGGGAQVRIANNLDIFTSAEYQHLGEAITTASNKSASLNLDHAVSWRIGLGYKF